MTMLTAIFHTGLCLSGIATRPSALQQKKPLPGSASPRWQPLQNRRNPLTTNQPPRFGPAGAPLFSSSLHDRPIQTP